MFVIHEDWIQAMKAHLGNLRHDSTPGIMMAPDSFYDVVNINVVRLLCLWPLSLCLHVCVSLDVYCTCLFFCVSYTVYICVCV